MHTSLAIKYNHFNYSSQLKKFMNTLLKPMHRSPLKTLKLITATFLDVKKPKEIEIITQDLKNRYYDFIQDTSGEFP